MNCGSGDFERSPLFRTGFRHSPSDDIYYSPEWIHPTGDIGALIDAAKNNNVDIVRTLSKTVDVNTHNGRALKYASENGNTEIVKILLDSGANVNNYALTQACVNGHTQTVKILLDAGANINACNDYDLFVVAEKGHTEIMDLLVKARENRQNRPIVPHNASRSGTRLKVRSAPFFGHLESLLDIATIVNGNTLYLL